jgi:hypothetical protein
MVVDQAVTAPIVNDQFNEVTLNTPHAIDVSQDMFVGMDVNASGGWPAGCDAGPAIVGFGDMFNDGTGWVAMSQPPNSLNYNWNLAAYIEPAKKGALASPVILTQTPVNNPKGLNMSTSGIVYQYDHQREHLRQRQDHAEQPDGITAAGIQRIPYPGQCYKPVRHDQPGDCYGIDLSGYTPEHH